MVIISGLITRPLILGQEIARVRVIEIEMLVIREVREIEEEREVREVEEVIRSLKRVIDSGFLGEE